MGLHLVGAKHDGKTDSSAISQLQGLRPDHKHVRCLHVIHTYSVTRHIVQK